MSARRRLFPVIALALASAAAPAAELRVALAPARDPEGMLWRLELRSVEPDALEGEYGTAPDGTWRKGGLPRKGRYHVVVKTDAGQPWWKTEKPVTLEEEVTTLPVALSAAKVKGTLTWGGGPVAAQLVFSDEHVGTRVTARSHKDGTFEVALPRSGRWDVGVTCPRPTIRDDVRAEVEKHPDGSFDTAIALVGDDIQGEVVDTDGREMPSVFVTLSCRCPELPKVDETDARGCFRFARPGLSKYLLSAYSRANDGMGADPVEVEYRPREGAPFVTLIVVKRKELHFRLAGASGQTLLGVRVQGLLDEGDLMGGRFLSAREDGVYLWQVSPNARSRCVQLGAPARGIAPDLTPLDDREEVQTVPVGSASGILALHAPPRDAGSDLLLRGGCLTWVFSLAHAAGVWRASETDGLRIPVAPGAWTLCRATPEELHAYRAGVAAFSRCATALVPAGGIAAASLPAFP